MNSLFNFSLGPVDKKDVNNKPSGDGTDGKTTDPLLNILRLGREIMLKNYSPSAKFRTGDIVFDEVHGEHGIVLGEKPFPVINNIESVVSQAAYYFTSATAHRTMLLLTFYQSEGKEIKSGDINSFDWRIRYVNTRALRKIEDIRDYHKKMSESDLKFFCENQCIQECSKECVLWKYRKL